MSDSPHRRINELLVHGFPVILVGLAILGAAGVWWSAEHKGARKEAALDPKKTEVSSIVAELDPKKTEVSPIVAELDPKKTEVSPIVAELDPTKTEVSPIVAKLDPTKTEVSPIAAEPDLRAETDVGHRALEGSSPGQNRGRPDGEQKRRREARARNVALVGEAVSSEKAAASRAKGGSSRELREKENGASEELVASIHSDADSSRPGREVAFGTAVHEKAPMPKGRAPGGSSENGPAKESSQGADETVSEREAQQRAGESISAAREVRRSADERVSIERGSREDVGVPTVAAMRSLDLPEMAHDDPPPPPNLARLRTGAIPVERRLLLDGEPVSSFSLGRRFFHAGVHHIRLEGKAACIEFLAELRPDETLYVIWDFERGGWRRSEAVGRKGRWPVSIETRSCEESR